jgi:hypothetical protein
VIGDGGVHPGVHITILLQVSVFELESGHTFAVADRFELDAEIGDESGGAEYALDFIENGWFHRRLSWLLGTIQPQPGPACRTRRPLGVSNPGSG